MTTSHSRTLSSQTKVSSIGRLPNDAIGVSTCLLELLHGVGGTPGEQRFLAKKVLFMVIPNIRTC